MKRLLFLTTMLLCSLLTFAQFEGTVIDSQGVRYTANNDASTCYVSGLESSYSSEIVIPEDYQGRIVTSIGNRAFYYCSSLTSIVIPNSVTSIGGVAFNGTAWYNNQPDGLVYAGKVAYKYKGTMPDNTHITLLEGTLGIAGSAFQSCRGLTSVEIPNSVTSIGADAFGDCSGLTSVTIPNSVTSIGEYAFWGCSSLTSVTIGNSVTSIGEKAFRDCSSLTSVIFHCKTIDDWFRNTPSLKTVIIGNGVTNISLFAFAYCDSLSSMIVSSENNTYDSRDNCNAIIETATNTLIAGCKDTMIPNSVTSIGIYAFYGSGLTSVEIPNSVTSIGACAFIYCSSLTSVTIPNSVTNIGRYTFSGCTGLTTMVVSSGNSIYDSRNNCNAIIETATNTLISGCKNTVIPNSVTSIGYSAFGDCSSLTSVEIPNSVTSIGDYAFSRCKGLTSVTIPNSVTSIGKGAFQLCTGLTSVEIPNSVSSIGESAFSSCSSLTSVEIPNSVTDIGRYAFSGCRGLTSVEIPNSVTSIGDCAFFDCENLSSVTIGNGVTSIGHSAFHDCWSLTSVTVKNENPVEIESETFSNRANATLYVPAGCKEAYEAANYWKDFKEIIEMDIQPIDTGETVDFGSDIDGDTDLDGNIVGDIYYVISNDDGGYDVAEGCIVVTTPTDDSNIDGQDIFGEEFQNNYTGIVLKVPAGRGTITVEAQTIGTMVLKVKIGTAAPVTMELDGRLKVSFPYDVTEPTYVYIYGGSNASAAPDMAGSAAGGELKLYGIEVAPGATGIEPIDHSTLNIEHYFTLDGRMLQGEPTQKGVYIVNGRKVVIK